jgi:hypothetical protein
MFLIKFKRTIQVTEDMWDYIYQEKLFPETATLAEIKAWERSIVNNNSSKKMCNIELTEPES